LAVDDDRDEELVDIALRLMAEQGFDVTSVTQIAAAAGVSPESVAGRFETADAIVLAVVDDMLAAVVDALADIEPGQPAGDALLAPHSQMLENIVGGAGPITQERLQSMGAVVMASPDLQTTVTARRLGVLSEALAEYLGVRPDDEQVAHKLKLWSAVVAGTYVAALDRRGRFDPDVDTREPERMSQRLRRTFRIIMGPGSGR
jgi:AcrR family transcriptional regulator